MTNTSFRPFRSRAAQAGGFARQIQVPAPVARPEPVEMALDFPCAQIEAVEVCVFGGKGNLENPKAEAHVKVVGNMSGSRFSLEVGRYDPTTNSPRITQASLWAWAEKHSLILTHDDPEQTNSVSEKYVVRHLVAAGGINPTGGFKAA